MTESNVVTFMIILQLILSSMYQSHNFLVQGSKAINGIKILVQAQVDEP